MTIDKRISLREAERVTGINRHTLRLWLEEDLGLIFPSVPRGSKFLVFEKDVEAVLQKRTPLAVAKVA
jgi:hypothetical protein